MTSNLKISAVCVTYGRTKLLENAIACFQYQDYQGPTKLVILNTCPKQNLSLDTPDERIFIVNVDERPATLGDARNIAVNQCFDSDLILVWDDDDAYLPHLISTFAAAYEPGNSWIWLSKRLWAEGKATSIKGIVGACHGGCFAFSYSAWQRCGGYPSVTVGEDRIFVNKVLLGNGQRVEVTGTPPFICWWGNGAYHVSGEGEDTPEKVLSAHERVDRAFRMRVRSGEEKTGDIALRPKLAHDWPALADEFMAQHLKKKSMSKDVCIIMLGRFGDITNVLPIALHIHNSYAKPHFMVSREFASILDGVSYVEPYVVDLKNSDLVSAIDIANKEFGHVIVAQVWGDGWFQPRETESYNKEAWRQCGFLHKFGQPDWRPLFDKRDEDRENALLAKVGGGVKAPLIVVAAQSTSSPFRKGNELVEAIRNEFGQAYTVFDLTTLRAERIYDILKLLERARAIVTVDTAVVHLAAATETPTVLLKNPTPWLGTVPMDDSVAVFSYAEVSETMKPVIEVTCEYAQGGGEIERPCMMPTFAVTAPTRTIIHAVEMHHSADPVEANRKGIAQESWKALYDKGVVPRHYDSSMGRNAHDEIGEPRKLPYLKDVLAYAMANAQPDDIIFWTNDDNFLHPSLVEALRYHVSLYEVCCSQRCEFINTAMPPASRPHTEFAGAGRAHMGRDLFAFTVDWLDRHWNEIPDAILGCSDFDLHLACIVRNHFKIKSTRRNLEDCIFPAELERGYVSHQYHPPAWNRPEYTNSSPGQLHNRSLFAAWAKINAPHLQFDKFGCI